MTITNDQHRVDLLAALDGAHIARSYGGSESTFNELARDLTEQARLIREEAEALQQTAEQNEEEL